MLHVAPAGNSGKAGGSGNNCLYPARWDSLIATAATQQDDTRGSFSSTCPELELAAPGVGINSTVPGGAYESLSGTSMASPHVAGIAALVLACGCLTDENGGGVVNHVDARLRLQKTAKDLGTAGRDTHYGYGLVYAPSAAPPAIIGLSASPNPFSPNGDGVKDNNSVSFSLNKAASRMSRK